MQLKRRVETSEWEESGQCLGDLFNKIVPFLKLYSVYVSNYDLALTTVMEQRKQNQPFNTFLKECAALPECKSLSFEAYLITPIQRIPRYKMLFQDLLKHTPESHPDFKNLEKSFIVVDEVAKFVNQTIKDQEGMGKLLQIQKAFSGLQESLLVPGRKLLKEGVLMKVCRKDNKPRVFFLFSDVLLYGAVLSATSYKYHLTLKLETVQASLRDDTEELKNSLSIKSSNKSFVIFAESPEVRDSWVSAINEASEGRRRNQKTLRVEGEAKQPQKLNMRESFLAPVWRPDSDVSQCMICEAEFTMMKRRHHCRNCGQIFCSSCCGKRCVFSSFLPRIFPIH